MTTNKTFQVGKLYFMTSVGDSGARWTYAVEKRTDKTVWIREVDRDSAELLSRRVTVYNGEEQVFPLGKYSMAPILGASSETYPDINKKVEALLASAKVGLQATFKNRALLPYEKWNAYLGNSGGVIICREAEAPPFLDNLCKVNNWVSDERNLAAIEDCLKRKTWHK